MVGLFINKKVFKIIRSSVFEEQLSWVNVEWIIMQNTMLRIVTITDICYIRPHFKYEQTNKWNHENIFYKITITNRINSNSAFFLRFTPFGWGS